jgi:Ser/Thr protein kinase RdoA (MazF antagonist)
VSGAGAVFAGLTPEAVLAQAERAMGLRCSAVCRPLPSYINRVYEIALADGTPRIVKFYRPGRWSHAALQDELDFLVELHEDEVPVVPPLAGADGVGLHAADGGGWFALFPKKGGRALDEPAGTEWAQLGRLIARMHAIGARHPPADRITLHPAHSGRAHLDAALTSNALPRSLRPAYERAAQTLLELIEPLFAGVDMHRIHGDCHRMNILHRPGEGFHLIDFDDMAVGPAVQDVWMLLPGRLADARMELELFLEGYETFHAFPRETLRLVEPLRALRFLHYTAWCVRQADDGGFARLAADWGSPAYWQQETEELEAQTREIEKEFDAR